MNFKSLIILTSISAIISPNFALADSPPEAKATKAAEEARVDGELSRALDKLSKIELKGEVSVTNTHDKISKTIDELTSAAIQNDPEMVRLNKGFVRYTKKREKVASKVAGALNYGILTRGDMPSSEAGDVILNEKVKLKSKGSALYARQKQMDQTHMRVVSAVMDIAMGLGTHDQTRADAVLSNGTAALTKLVGKAESERAINELREVSTTLQVPEGVYDQNTWSVSEQQKRADVVLEAAINSDQSISEIKNIVHKYNHHSKLYRVSSRVMNVTLSIAGLSPTLIGPAAQITLLCYIMATGGPEEDKLMSELYLDKRLQSRFDLLKDKTQVALDQYQIALLTKNPMLLVCSQSLVKQMTTDELANHTFARNFVPETHVDDRSNASVQESLKSEATGGDVSVVAKKAVPAIIRIPANP